MATQRPPTIDPTAAARWQSTIPAVGPWLHEEIARRMQQRLDWIRQRPESWAHWDPVRGGMDAHALIAQRYPEASCYLIEPAGPSAELATRALVPARRWWRPAQWRAGLQQVVSEPPPGAVQLVWSNMALHMTADPQALLARWHAALATDGFLMFSCLGPDSVATLRTLYRTLGWGEAGSAFTDMHDWGDMLVAAGFAEPVMDMERITLTWSTPAELLAELRSVGRNLHPARFAGLRTPRWRTQLEQALARQLSDSATGGRLALDFEIVYGHAFKPAPRQQPGADRHVGLDEMRSMLKAGRSTASHTRAPKPQQS